MEYGAAGNRDGSKNSLGGITLSEFLIITDGVPAREGHILIMSTNKSENLDKALIRPGRVDFQVCFTLLDQHAAKKLFLVFSTEDPSIDFIVDPETGEIRCTLTPIFKDLTFDQLAELSDSFAKKIPEDRYSSAQLQVYLMSFNGDAISAECNVEGWMQQVDKEMKDGILF